MLNLFCCGCTYSSTSAANLQRETEEQQVVLNPDLFVKEPAPVKPKAIMEID